MEPVGKSLNDLCAQIGLDLARENGPGDGERDEYGKDDAADPEKETMAAGEGCFLCYRLGQIHLQILDARAAKGASAFSIRR